MNDEKESRVVQLEAELVRVTAQRDDLLMKSFELATGNHKDAMSTAVEIAVLRLTEAHGEVFKRIAETVFHDYLYALGQRVRSPLPAPESEKGLGTGSVLVSINDLHDENRASVEFNVPHISLAYKVPWEVAATLKTMHPRTTDRNDYGHQYGASSHTVTGRSTRVVIDDMHIKGKKP